MTRSSGWTKKDDCYTYIRQMYSVPAYIGVRVRCGGPQGRWGTLVKGHANLHYLHVWFDGLSRPALCHPTDGMEYFVEGRL